MKKILLILGIFILLTILGIWVYLFLYGTPKSAEEVFGNFSFGRDRDAVENPYTPQQPAINDESVVDQTRSALRQLTTRPVAGAVFTDTSIRYAERGTGHIYEILLPYGEERIISNTTIPQTMSAVFSKRGDKVAVTTAREENNETIVGTITSSTAEGGGLSGVSLPPRATNIGWSATGLVNYLLETADGAAGFEYNDATQKSKQLFAIPLRDVVVYWNPLYVATTPSARQLGYVYKVANGTLSYVTKGGYGLTAVPYADQLIVTETVEDTLTSYALPGRMRLPIALLPEKCTEAPAEIAVLYCGASTGHGAAELPDDWYKGEMSFTDLLWRIDVGTRESALLSNLALESGREIDISHIGADETGQYIYMVNKNDGTLWLFDTTFTP